MNTYIIELYAHQEWADAEHWRAFEAYPPALSDKAILERLLHIHLVQHAFLWITGPQTLRFEPKKLEDFPQTAHLKDYARQGHADLQKLLTAGTPDWFDESIEIVWFQPTLRLLRRHALMQAAMHSHYHRGQNATRLRELGSTPPTTDFITWIKDGQPAARWD